MRIEEQVSLLAESAMEILIEEVYILYDEGKEIRAKELMRASKILEIIIDLCEKEITETTTNL